MEYLLVAVPFAILVCKELAIPLIIIVDDPAEQPEALAESQLPLRGTILNHNSMVHAQSKLWAYRHLCADEQDQLGMPWNSLCKLCRLNKWSWTHWV